MRRSGMRGEGENAKGGWREEKEKERKLKKLKRAKEDSGQDNSCSTSDSLKLYAREDNNIPGVWLESRLADQVSTPFTSGSSPPKLRLRLVASEKNSSTSTVEKEGKKRRKKRRKKKIRSGEREGEKKQEKPDEFLLYSTPVNSWLFTSQGEITCGSSSKFFTNNFLLFYILIRDGIRFVQNVTPPVFVKYPRFETLWTRKNGFREGVWLSACLSVYTITFERIDRLDWNLVHFFSAKKWRSSSLASHFWLTVLVLSVKNGFYKIKKSIFRPNYSRYEKMFKSKIVHLKQTYKFYLNHFLEKRMVFILIKKTLLKIKSCGFRPNNARYEKMLKSKIVHLKKIYNFYFDHFLIKRRVFVLNVKNVIKSKIQFSGQTLRHTKQMLRNKIVRFKKIYKCYFDHFLIGIIFLSFPYKHEKCY